MRPETRFLLQGGILGAMLVGTCVLVYPYIIGRSAPPSIDTKLESGSHITFAFVTPTGSGIPEFHAAVLSARDSVRSRAIGAGYYYSTVGISDNWSVKKGLQLLGEYGAFDEVVVGRNWLNSGVARYIDLEGGTGAVPAVVVLRQDVDLTNLPVRYSDPEVVLRLEGGYEIDQWVKAGARLQLPEAEATK